MNFPGSLSGSDIRPLCSDHHPKARLRDDVLLFYVEIKCETCGWCAQIHPAHYRLMPDAIPEILAAIQKLLHPTVH